MASLRSLEVLAALAETGSLTAVAAALHLSQPAVSHQVRALEREVGAPVVERLPRGVRLTAVGAAMLDAARAATSGAQRAVALGRATAAGEAGLLRLACAESMTAGLLAPALAAWRRSHPDVALELRECRSADLLLEELLAGTTDVAVGPRPSPTEAAVLRVVGREELVVVCAPQHPFAARRAVTLREVGAEPFVHLARTNGLADWLDAVAAAAGTALVPAVRVQSALSAAALAAAGLGVALVPRSARPDTAGSAVVPLDPPLLRDVVALHRSPLQPLVARFEDVVRRTLAA